MGLWASVAASFPSQATTRYALPGSAHTGQGPAGAAAMGTPLLSCLLDGVGHQSFAPEPGSTDAGPRVSQTCVTAPRSQGGLWGGEGTARAALRPAPFRSTPQSRVGTAGGSRRTLGPGSTTAQAAFLEGPAPQGDPSTQLAGVPLASPERERNCAARNLGSPSLPQPGLPSTTLGCPREGPHTPLRPGAATAPPERGCPVPGTVRPGTGKARVPRPAGLKQL